METIEVVNKTKIFKIGWGDGVTITFKTSDINFIHKITEQIYKNIEKKLEKSDFSEAKMVIQRIKEK